MSGANSKLVSVLEAILRGHHCEEGEDALAVAEARGIAGLIRDRLAITDSPSSRDPIEIADFIYWNVGSASRAATERYLAALPAAELASLRLGDVLACLTPGLADDIEARAREAEAERSTG